jgi:outer membrane receptor protein involved in Fe transport
MGRVDFVEPLIGNIPYHPNVSGDFTLDISPGGGVKFEMTGRYIGSRFISAFADDKLDSYFLVDMSISKRLNKNVSLSVKIFNLFNQKFETRRNYDQPDMVSVGGINFYW